MKPETLNLIGQRLSGNLILSLRAGKNSQAMATAQCSACGKVFETHLSSLKKGNTRSCGCLARKVLLKVHTKHGLSGHKHFSRANSIDQRCNNPKHPAYSNYGGRGIQCRFADITELINYLDKLPGYFEGASIDRINNDGHYEKGNLRWANIIEQNNNQRARTNNTSGISGIRWTKDRSAWKAQLNRKGKNYIKYFPTHLEAIFWLKNKQLEVLGYTKHLGLPTDRN